MFRTASELQALQVIQPKLVHLEYMPQARQLCQPLATVQRACE